MEEKKSATRTAQSKGNEFSTGDSDEALISRWRLWKIAWEAELEKEDRIRLLAGLLGNRSYAKIKEIGERQKKMEFSCQNCWT